MILFNVSRLGDVYILEYMKSKFVRKDIFERRDYVFDWVGGFEGYVKAPLIKDIMVI